MKLSSNFHRFHPALGLKGTIDLFAKVGYEGIDFNTDFAEYHTDAHEPDFYRKIKVYAEDKGIGFYQTHAPYMTGFVMPEERLVHMEKVVKGMYHSSLLGADMVVVHPGVYRNEQGGQDWDEIMDFNYEYFKKLIPYAEDYGVKVAIENLPGHVTKTPEKLLELLDRLDNDVFTICYDVGHDQIATENPVDTISKLGSRIGCTHIHDNNGKQDIHTLPHFGVIDWEAVMKAFADSGYTGNLNYEAAYFLHSVPNDLLPQSAQYMADVGKHLIDRYEYYKG